MLRLFSRFAFTTAVVAVCLVWCGNCGAQRALTPEIYKSKMSAALQDIQSRSDAQQGRPVEIALNLFLAHEAWIKGVPLEPLLLAVDAFAEAGADRVDLNVGQFPFVDGDEENIAKYDAVVARIRERGMKLALNPQYSPVHHRLRSFREWERVALKLYPDLARRYHPDIFVVAHEPSTMSSRLGGKASVGDWTKFVRSAARIVKEVSPTSRIGAGGLPSERAFFEAFADLPEVDVLTLDIYSLRELPVNGEMIRYARAKGKPVYIEETWRPPYFEPKPGMTLEAMSLKNVGNREFEALDGKWIRALTAWARAMELEAITPVWMFPLFHYSDTEVDLSDPAYNRAVIEAIMKGERTPTFRTIQDLARVGKSKRRTDLNVR